MTSSSEPISAAAFEQQTTHPAPPTARPRPATPHDPASPILREAGKSVLHIGMAAAVIVPLGIAGAVAAPVILAANLLRNRRKA